MLKVWYTQVARNAQLKDLKPRMLDHFRAAGYTSMQLSDIRLWMYLPSSDKNDRPNLTDLEEACKSIKEGFERHVNSEGPASEP